MASLEKSVFITVIEKSALLLTCISFPKQKPLQFCYTYILLLLY